jgi:sulfite reductase (NADPH) flavoprotein alpha-component
MTFKKLLSQFHWIVGISAGIVLAIVGITGAILSFEGPIVDRLNRDARRVAAPEGQPRLTPGQLLARVAVVEPERVVTGLVVYDDPRKATRVTFAANSAGGGSGGRGEARYVNPYTAELLPPSTAGEKFLRDVRSLHRWLMLGELGNRDVGRQVVGACTMLLVFMALTGLYLRWPGRHTLKTWLVPNFALKGRAFLWNLHSTLGTWVLPVYLLIALTGLQWSYEWYRDGLYAIAGAERPGAGAREGRSPREGGSPRPDNATAARPDLTRPWEAFIAGTAATGYSTVTINLAGDSKRPIEFRYLEPEPAHDRAYSTLLVERGSSSVGRHERYADKKPGGKFVSSIFPLHSGSYFGTTGTILFLLASLGMPVFAVTGWMMYLQRRRRARALEPAGATTTANS